MSWLYLLIASLLEVTWAVGLKQTGNWSKLLPSAVVIAAYLLGLVFLSLAVRDIPASIAYSVWVGLGIVGVAGLDIFSTARRFRPRNSFASRSSWSERSDLKVLGSA